MVKLTSMNESDYQEFIDLSVRDQIEGHVKTGNFTRKAAQAFIESMLPRILPDGLVTPNHFFYCIIDDVSDTRVGYLWFALQQRGEDREVFIWDIQIEEEYRRQGYGTSTFMLVEDKTRKMGLDTITLQVFEHNLGAKAMYLKLGYEKIGDRMVKKL